MSESHRQEQGGGRGPDGQEDGVLRVEHADATPEDAHVKMPSIGKLDDLLQGATAVLRMKDEVDALMERQQALLEKLDDVDAIRESRLARVERFNPLKDIKPDDYERLLAEGVIDETFASRFESDPEKFVATLKKLDETIAQFESVESPSAEISAEREKLLEMRVVLQGELKDRLDERREELAERREETRNNVLAHYSARVKELERTIAEIVSDPRVAERLQTVAEEEMRAEFEKRDAEKRAFEEKMSKKEGTICKKLRALSNPSVPGTIMP